MPEQHQNHPNQNKPDRPAPSPEQLSAFRTAYTMLTQKANEGERVMASVSGDIEDIITRRMHSADGHNPDEFIDNAVGAPALLTIEADSTDARSWAWVYSYDEAYVHDTSKLGSFSVATSEHGTEQDLYEFYTDGNIEKLAFSLGSDGVEDTITHVGWLTPEETSALGLLLEEVSVIQPNE